MTSAKYPPRFKPAPYAPSNELRVDDPSWIEHVIAVVSLPDGTGLRRELVIGIDAGHVIRVIPITRARAMRPRAFAELELHAQRGESLRIDTDDLYLLDVQVVEHVPDVPGADDPLYLYGVLRGPYPAGVDAGTAGVEGQLATVRSGLLDGFVMGVERAFRYAPSPYGTRCVPLVLAGADAAQTSMGRGIVLAFPLAPPLGREHDMANDLVAAQLAHDVIGATRRDLGDDLGTDPVPVPSRQAYERELERGGWVIATNVARRKSKGRFASLFTPAETQVLPPEATLPELAALVPGLLYRLRTTWPEQHALHARVPPVIRVRPPTQPPPRPPIAQAPLVPTRDIVRPPRLVTASYPTTVSPGFVPPPPQTLWSPPAPLPVPQPAARPRLRPATNPSPIDFLAWVADLVDEHAEPDKAPRVSKPARVVEPPSPQDTVESRLDQWLFDLSDDENQPPRKPRK